MKFKAVLVLRFASLATVAVLLGLLATNRVHADMLGPIYDPFSNSNLYVVPLGSWTQDEAAAQALGGNLITIQSAAENQFVVDNVLQDFSGSGGPDLSSVPLWIGLYDPTGAAQDDGSGSQHAANFVWVDGSASAYRNWYSGSAEPNDSSPGEYYATINWHVAAGVGPSASGAWNDTPNDGTSFGPVGLYYGIAAVPTPEPSTLVMFVIGAAALLASGLRNRR
jgi:Lectin C-type domain/PEP-CTERM motif